jgi:hypothetical protein
MPDEESTTGFHPSGGRASGAALFDLDGFLIPTASAHAAAGKKLFALTRAARAVATDGEPS